MVSEQVDRKPLALRRNLGRCGLAFALRRSLEEPLDVLKDEPELTPRCGRPAGRTGLVHGEQSGEFETNMGELGRGLRDEVGCGSLGTVGSDTDPPPW